MRIVSLAPSITETIFALNAQQHLVGISDYCTYPAETETIDKIGGFSAPDLERILALKPTLVICTTMHKLDKMQALFDAGIVVEQVIAQKLFDAPSMILEVGRIIGKEEDAQRLAGKVESGFKQVLAKASDVSVKRVCYLCTSNPFCGWKPKCQTNELVSQLGGILSKYEKDNLAQSIVDSDPEVIIIPYSKTTEDYKIQANFMEQNPILNQTNALKTGKVFNMNGELLSRPGPRAGDGLMQLFNLIHS